MDGEGRGRVTVTHADIGAPAARQQGADQTPPPPDVQVCASRASPLKAPVSGLPSHASDWGAVRVTTFHTMDDLDRLFRTYHAPLVRYLTRRLGDRDLAEELAQETFVRAMRNGPVASERSWLFAVATNLVRDESRRDARQRRHLELLRAEHIDRVQEPEPTSLERMQEAALARRAVNALAEKDRVALLMKEEGLDYHEIAAALGLSASSVGTTLSRARRRLVDVYEALQREQESHGSGGASVGS